MTAEKMMELADYLAGRGIDNESGGREGPFVLIKPEKRDLIVAALRSSAVGAGAREALETIAGWRKVNIAGEYEHGLRGIIRSIIDCAETALQSEPVQPAGKGDRTAIIATEVLIGHLDHWRRRAVTAEAALPARAETIEECVRAVEDLKIKHAGRDAGNGYRYNQTLDAAVRVILALHDRPEAPAG